MGKQGILIGAAAIVVLIVIMNIFRSGNDSTMPEVTSEAKQKQTIVSMRNIGTAWMSWLTDQVAAAAAGNAKPWNGTRTELLTYESVRDLLHPSYEVLYMQEVPRTDGWRYDFQFCLNRDLPDSNVMVICSPGSNGRLGDNPTGETSCCGASWEVGAFDPARHDQDIVWADGYFVRWPSSE